MMPHATICCRLKERLSPVEFLIRFPPPDPGEARAMRRPPYIALMHPGDGSISGGRVVRRQAGLTQTAAPRNKPWQVSRTRWWHVQRVAVLRRRGRDRSRWKAASFLLLT